MESVETLLDPLREAWESHCKQNGLGVASIGISSGYRCPQLNKAVGGSSTSAHCHGYAFDLMPMNGKILPDDGVKRDEKLTNKAGKQGKR